MKTKSRAKRLKPPRMMPTMETAAPGAEHEVLLLLLLLLLLLGVSLVACP